MPINNDYIHPDLNNGKRWNSTSTEEVKFPNGTTEYAYRHPNGGGWVAVSSYVSLSVFVDVMGCVYGAATVTGDVHVNPFGQIYNGAKVSGNVRVGVDDDGSSSTRGTAQIRGTGTVMGTVLVSANSYIELSNNKVMGDIVVSENTAIVGSQDVFGNYFTVDSGPTDTSYPNGPQAHSKLNPITRAESIGLKAGSYSLTDNDFSDIERLSIRDGQISGAWQGDPSEEPPDPEPAQTEITTRPDPLPPPTSVKMSGKKAPPSGGIEPSTASTTVSKTKPTAVPIYSTCPTAIMDNLKNISRNGSVPSGVIYNLEKLCQHVVQPIFNAFPNALITSGYRNDSHTHHGKGMAVDIQVPGKSQLEIGKWIDQHLDYSQLILEYNAGISPSTTHGKWVHVSYIHPGTPLPYTGHFSSNVRDKRVADNGGPSHFRTKHVGLVGTDITTSLM